MPRPFVIFALPRSRTAWLAHFLGYGGAMVGHDVAVETDSISDFIHSLRSGWMLGTVETGAMMAWKVLRQELPEAQFVVVRRDREEVRQSLARFGLVFAEGELERREALLDIISCLEGTRTLSYSDLWIPDVCRELFENLLGRAWDEDWYQRLRATNIQIDIGQRKEQLLRRAGAIEGLKAEVLAASRKIPTDPSWLMLN